VSTSDTSSEPRQPKRFEKRTNTQPPVLVPPSASVASLWSVFVAAPVQPEPLPDDDDAPPAGVEPAEAPPADPEIPEASVPATAVEPGVEHAPRMVEVLGARAGSAEPVLPHAARGAIATSTTRGSESPGRTAHDRRSQTGGTDPTGR
jgi:hypothetical protein